MDEHDPHRSVTPSPSGEGANDAAAAPSGDGAQPVEPVIELASSEAPTIVPSLIDATGSARTGSARAEQSSTGAFDGMREKTGRRSARPADMVFVPAADAGRGASRWGRFALVAGAIVMAAAVGGLAGALGASSIARVMPKYASAPPAPDGVQSLRGAITQLRSEVTALKASVDANSRNANAQFTKLADRIEHVQSDISAKPTKTSDSLERRADVAAAKDVTGSIAPPPVASAMPLAPTVPPQPAIVPGWVLRDVYRGAAILQGRLGALVEVRPGDTLPGIGRIESVRRVDGHWVVFTSRGMISSLQ